MTTRERREEYSSANVVRVLHPSRPLSPHNNVIEFDNNLDNLLEDLQASVSRPGSSLGQPITNYSTSSQVQYLQPANMTTVARERSLSPNLAASNERKVYKTSKYEYKTSTSGRPDEAVTEVYQRNINQLDTLLNDLERERDTSVDRNKRSLSNVGIDSGLLEPGTKVVKTTTTYTTSGGGDKQPVSRELVYDSPNSYEIRQSRSRQRSPSYENASTTVRNVSYSSDTGLYGGINRSMTPQRTVSPIKNEEYYTETRTISPDNVLPKNVHYNETVKVDSASTALQKIPLSDDILPKPNTKVTTTVRTYTYELPPDHDVNQKLLYTNETVNQTTNTQPIITYPERDVPPSHHVNPGSKTIVMKNETYNTTNNVHEYPVPPIINHQLPPSTSKTVYYKRDTKQSSTNYYPGQPNGSPYPSTHEPIEPPPGGVSVYPQQPQPVKYTNSPYPPQTNATYIFKQEHTNTTNNKYGSPLPMDRYPERHDTYPRDQHPNQHPYPQIQQHPHPPPHPPHHQQHHPQHQPQPQPTTVTYKYSSTTTNANRNIYPPQDEREPLLQPFPTDGIAPSQVDGNPPKRLDDLMATFGDNGPINYTSNNHHTREKAILPQRAQEPSNSNQNQTKVAAEPKNVSSTSKNIAGPPVYYPPGHEMFAKKEAEEGGGAYRAQGSYAKASGKYMYESESKSKSSSKSGATVVPVCLPLCCAMPCTIM